MKALNYIALLCFLLGFTACSSDDNSSKNSQSNNQFTYKGKTYELKAGVIEKDGTDWSDDGSMEYYIVLVTSDIIEDSEGEIIPSEQIISMIDFNLFSKNNSKPKTGTYNFDEDNNIDFTFNYSELILNVNWEADWDSSDLIFVESGFIEMHKTGDIYKMNFEFTSTTDEVIKGHYEGKLILYEYDDYYRPAPNNILKAKRK